MKLRFENVGRAKASFDVPITPATSLLNAGLIREVKRQAALRSNEIELAFDARTGEGQVIVGSVQVVGTFRMVE